MRPRTWMTTESPSALGRIGLLALLVVACSEDEPPPQPGSFDRPTRLAFMCFDVGAANGPRPIAMEECEPANAESTPAGLPRHVLHALVVQSSRGEVAAVDLVDDKAIDSREDIPGYTFLAVGELPTAIAAPARARNVDYTYVLSSGSRDVTVLRTKAFRQIEATMDDPIRQTVQLPGGAADTPLDMVLAPEEDALFVSVPNAGRLLRLPIVRCEEGEPCEFGTIDSDGITELPLTASVGRVQPPAGGELMSTDPYAKVCEYGGPIANRPLPVPPLPDDAADTTPRPTGLALDSFCQPDRPCSQRLLVADEALPLIHVVDIDAWREVASDAAVLAPIQTGAPTRTVAVTPRVPLDLSPEAPETQYVYAIDARDGSVLVTQDGQLLEVGTYGGRPDRITLGVGTSLPLAVSLSVLTPAFDVHGPAAQYARADVGEDDADEIPACTDAAHPVRRNERLRGVFLAVGAGDGSVRIIDVHDMELAECRACEKCTCPDNASECDECQNSNWDPYPVVRHRPRITVNAPDTVDAVRLAPVASPSFVSGGNLVQVRVNGTTSDPFLSGLDCTTCGDRKARAFPPNELSVSGAVDAGMNEQVCDADSARVCALSDPWAELDDWIASVRGAIPGTRGGEGRILQTDQGVRFSAEGRFCSLGVLGAEQLEGRAGDEVAVLGELAPESMIGASLRPAAYRNAVVDACNALVRRRDREESPVPIAFTIRESFQGELVLEPNLSETNGASPPEVAEAMAQRENIFANESDLVSRCFGNAPLTYEIRVGEGLVVVGTDQLGFLHRVRADEGTGRCVQDATQEPTRTGRAYLDTRFDNGFIAFQVAGDPVPPLDAALLVGLQTSTPKAVMNASLAVNEQVIAAVPYDLRWSGTDNSLYMVDIASRGLLQIPVDPFPSSVPRSIQ